MQEKETQIAVFKHKEMVRLSTRQLNQEAGFLRNSMTDATESSESPDKLKRPGLKVRIEDDNGEPEAGDQQDDWQSNGSGDEANELSNLERSDSFNNAPTGGTDVINMDG